MNKFYKFCLFSFILLSDFVAFAQPDDEEDGGGGLEGGDPAPAPINGKLLILIFFVLFFAFYKLKSLTKKD